MRNDCRHSERTYCIDVTISSSSSQRSRKREKKKKKYSIESFVRQIVRKERSTILIGWHLTRRTKGITLIDVTKNLWFHNLFLDIHDSRRGIVARNRLVFIVRFHLDPSDEEFRRRVCREFGRQERVALSPFSGSRRALLEARRGFSPFVIFLVQTVSSIEWSIWLETKAMRIGKRRSGV